MEELIGKKNNQLTIIARSERKGDEGQTYVWCSCTCGKETEVRLNNFNSGSIKSCGCKSAQSLRSIKSGFRINRSPSEPPRISKENLRQGAVRLSIEAKLEQIRLNKELREMEAYG